MGFFIWKDTFNTGIDEIDRQHRSFLETLNEYYDLISVDKKAIVNKELIGKLKTYVATHFKYEESMLQVIGYKELEPHLKQHKYFESRILELDDANVQQSAEKFNGVLSFLRDWFLNHILEEDRKYITHVM